MPTSPLPDKLDAARRQAVTAATDAILARSLDTSPIDRDACRDAVARAYARRGLATPEIRFFDSPIAALRELQSRVPAGPAPAVPLPQQSLQDVFGDLGGWLVDQMEAAQPRATTGLGSEVEVSFNTELLDASDAVVRQPGWRSLSQLVHKRLGDVVHYLHAVDERLEAQVDRQAHRFLLYSGGADCLWRFAEHYARVQALADLGVLSAQPPELALGRGVLGNCGWINAFESLCLVCDRPEALAQEGRPRGEGGLRTRVRWRDGETCEAVYVA